MEHSPWEDNFFSGGLELYFSGTQENVRVYIESSTVSTRALSCICPEPVESRQRNGVQFLKIRFIYIYIYIYTGLFKIMVGVLTTCHTQYTWDSSICIFLFNRTTLQVFVTYLIGALYVHPLWFYKHQHDNRVRSKLSVACQRWLFQWRFAAILVNCAPSGEIHNYCTPHIIKENAENFLIHRCNYILLSQEYDKLLNPR
jgi:hypothetical protein